MTTPGRNNPCPCGSGKKFKQCCINKSVTTDMSMDNLMQQGYTALDDGDETRASDYWLELWNQIKTGLTPAIRSVEDAEIVFSGDTQCLFNWCQDMEQTLGNAGNRKQSLNDACINYCREFCTLLPDSSPVIIHNMKRAEIVALFRMGRIAEGELASQALITAFPNNAFSYINWGDLYHWPDKNGSWTADYDRAERLYRMALDADIDDEGRKDILERLDDLASTRHK